MYHTKFSATLIPDHLSATFTGEGESPEQARRSCEVQLAAYMSRVRIDNHPEVLPVLRAFTCIDTDYETTRVYPRVAQRKPRVASHSMKPRRGFFAVLDSLVQSLGNGIR